MKLRTCNIKGHYQESENKNGIGDSENYTYDDVWLSLGRCEQLSVPSRWGTQGLLRKPLPPRQYITRKSPIAPSNIGNLHPEPMPNLSAVPPKSFLCRAIVHCSHHHGGTVCESHSFLTSCNSQALEVLDLSLPSFLQEGMFQWRR